MTALTTLDVDLLLEPNRDGVEDGTQQDQEVGCDEDVEESRVEVVRGGNKDNVHVKC